MQATIEYSEIQSLVKSKTGREIGLSAIDERTVKAEAKVSVKVPFLGKIEKSVGVNVSVEKIEGNDVHLDEVEEARKVLDLVELTGIMFQEKGITVEGRFR